MNEDKSARYHRLRRRAQVSSLLAAAAALVGLVVAGGGPVLRTAGERVAGAVGVDGPARSAIVVVVAASLLVALLELVALPGACYVGLGLERRYGLSRQDAREWWRDHAKAAVLALVMGDVTALAIYGAIGWAGPPWWLLAGLLLAVLAAVLALGAPVVLLPLFYRVRPLSEGELVTRLTAMAAGAGAPVLGVYEWALGDKSRAANAALVGLGPTRRILLSDTLLQQYSSDEIEVIIAHELAHHVHGDIWKGVALEACQMTLALGLAHLAVSWWGAWVGVHGVHDVAGMPLLATAAGAWSLVTAPLLLAVSRRHERRADAFALALTSKADAFVSAMRRLGSQNLAEEAPSRLVAWLFHSHPTTSERVATAQRWGTEQGKPLSEGRELKAES